jgi:hypothetical protein
MIRADETEIVGNWIEVDGRVVADEACERIKALVNGHLVELGSSKESGGWDTLFQDPNDGRLWERTYLQGHMHGGGPPSLFNLSENDARKKYSQLFDLK